MNKQRILVMTKLFWPEGSGGEFATYLIAKDILSKHFELTIVSGTSRPAADILKHCRYVWWSLFTGRYKPIEWLKLIGGCGLFARIVGQAEIVYIPSHTLLPLAFIAKGIKPSIKVVVHLHNYQPLTYTSVILADRRLGMATDLIVERYEHGSLLHAVLTGVGHYVNLVSRLALHYADRVICVSRRQYEVLTERIPTLRSRAIVAYNPMPQLPNVEKRPNSEPTILYAGGDSYIKGFHVFMQAAINILRRGNYAVFLLAGRFRREHEVLVRKLNNTFRGRFRLLGRLPHEDVLRLYSTSYAVPVPSMCEESFPYVVLEAMLMGTLPIAARVGGIPEIVEGTYAERMMFTPGCSEEMADRMETVLSLSRDQLVDVGSKLREATLKRFNNGEVKRRLLEVFMHEA